MKLRLSSRLLPTGSRTLDVNAEATLEAQMCDRNRWFSALALKHLKGEHAELSTIECKEEACRSTPTPCSSPAPRSLEERSCLLNVDLIPR